MACDKMRPLRELAKRETSISMYGMQITYTFILQLHKGRSVVQDIPSPSGLFLTCSRIAEHCPIPWNGEGYSGESDWLAQCVLISRVS